jgi:hypothetical protein
VRLRYAATVDGMREAVDKRIETNPPATTGQSRALSTGKRDTIRPVSRLGRSPEGLCRRNPPSRTRSASAASARLIIT